MIPCTHIIYIYITTFSFLQAKVCDPTVKLYILVEKKSIFFIKLLNKYIKVLLNSYF